jgi:hypothetical protein
MEENQNIQTKLTDNTVTHMRNFQLDTEAIDQVWLKDAVRTHEINLDFRIALVEKSDDTLEFRQRRIRNVAVHDANPRTVLQIAGKNEAHDRGEHEAKYRAKRNENKAKTSRIQMNLSVENKPTSFCLT